MKKIVNQLPPQPELILWDNVSEKGIIICVYNNEVTVLHKSYDGRKYWFSNITNKSICHTFTKNTFDDITNRRAKA